MATVQNLVVNLLGNAKQLASTIRQSKAEVSGLSDFVNGQVVGLGSKVTGLVAGGFPAVINGNGNRYFVVPLLLWATHWLGGLRCVVRTAAGRS